MDTRTAKKALGRPCSGSSSESTNVATLREDNIPPHLRPPQLIVPGDYDLVYHSHNIERVFKREALIVWFSVEDYLGEIVLPRYYTVGVREFRGKRKISGKRRSDLVTEFALLFGTRGWRIDRIPVSWFKGVRVLGRVRTVTKDYDRRDVKTPYTVIAELKERI